MREKFKSKVSLVFYNHGIDVTQKEVEIYEKL